VTGPARSLPTVSAAEFRDAMALLVAPVAVATTHHEGRDWGFTASAVTGLSLDPPLLAVAIGRTSSCHKAFAEADEFVVNVLGTRNRDIAVRFAKRGIDRFAGGGTGRLPGTRLPTVADAVAHYRCRRRSILAVGDHDLVVGELTMVVRRATDRPLAWYSRDFHSTGWIGRD
jgi:flavin reductase ActVB